MHLGGRTSRRGLVLGVLLLGSACAGRAPSSVPADGAIPSLADAKRDVIGYVESGRYNADIAEVVAQARAWVERRAARGDKLAMALDVDETALSSLPSMRANDYGVISRGPCDLPAGPCGFGTWIEMAQAEAIAPVLGLARLARERGVAVFFIADRPERARVPTERNLKAAGYEWTGLVLKPDGAITQSAMDFKAPARKKIVDDGYTIIANVGDQVSDLEGGFAERTFKLPNPFYAVP